MLAERLGKIEGFTGVEGVLRGVVGGEKGGGKKDGEAGEEKSLDKRGLKLTSRSRNHWRAESKES